MTERRTRLAAPLAPLLLVACGLGLAPDGERDLVITNGSLIDGTGGRPIAQGTVVVRGDRITAAGPAEEIEIPADARVLDARGGTILPGIIDSHVHSVWEPSVRRQFLLAGVTSVCDLGSPIDRMAEFAVDSSDSGPTARGFRGGPIVTAPGGLPDAILHEDLNYEVASPEEARAGVEELARRGATMVKAYLHPREDGQDYPMVDLASLEAISEAAAALEMPVRAHVSRLAVLGFALDGGVDSIEHLPKALIDRDEFEAALADSTDVLRDLHDLVVAPEYEPLFRRMVEDEVVMVPTLARGLGRFHGNPDAGPMERAVGDAIVEVVRRFHEAGGVLALGTDYNANSGVEPAMPLDELRLFEAAGLTPMEVIEAATRHAARACGQGADLGTLEPGKLADLIVVAGDPAVDLGALADVQAVVRGGVVSETAR